MYKRLRDIHTYIFTSTNLKGSWLWAQATQAGHVRDLNGMRPTWQKKPAQSTLLLPIKENRKNIAMLVYNGDEDVLE